METAFSPETRMTAIPPEPYAVDIAQIVFILQIGYKVTTKIAYMQIYEDFFVYMGIFLYLCSGICATRI
jgi:hypothetical protein